jgi:hypothetical protein
LERFQFWNFPYRWNLEVTLQDKRRLQVPSNNSNNKRKFSTEVMNVMSTSDVLEQNISSIDWIHGTIHLSQTRGQHVFDR